MKQLIMFAFLFFTTNIFAQNINYEISLQKNGAEIQNFKGVTVLEKDFSIENIKNESFVKKTGSNSAIHLVDLGQDFKFKLKQDGQKYKLNMDVYHKEKNEKDKLIGFEAKKTIEVKENDENIIINKKEKKVFYKMIFVFKK